MPLACPGTSLKRKDKRPWAAGGAIIGFIAAYCLMGIIAGLIVLVVAITTGAGLIMFKQRKGLHTKKNDQGVFIYAYSKRI